MRYIFYPLLIFIIILSPFHSGFADSKNFRKTSWGMTQEQVKKSEPKSPDYTDHFKLVYLDKVLDETARVDYFFANSRLSGARYYIDLSKKPILIDKFIEELATFEKFSNALTSKYGPSIEKKNDFQGKKFGIYQILEKWIVGETKIIVFLMSMMKTKTLVVEYTGLKFESELMKAREGYSKQLKNREIKNIQDKL
jgi:hypothetical protein